MPSTIKDILLDKIKNYILSIAHAIFPTRLITTFFGIGYLPDWQGHWAAFFVIPLIGLIVNFTVGFSSSPIQIAATVLLFSAILFILGLIGIYVFQKTVFSDNRYEVTIHVAFGQSLMIAMSVPPILQITSKIFQFNTIVCEQFMHCANWFLYCATYLAAMLVPYFIFRLTDMIKPWPAYWIERDYHNATSNMVEGLSNAIYSTIFIYLLAFIVFDLDVVDSIKFNLALIRYLTSFVALF